MTMTNVPRVSVIICKQICAHKSLKHIRLHLPNMLTPAWYTVLYKYQGCVIKIAQVFRANNSPSRTARPALCKIHTVFAVCLVLHMYDELGVFATEIFALLLHRSPFFCQCEMINMQFGQLMNYYTAWQKNIF